VWDVLRDLVEREGGVVTVSAARQVVPEWTLRRAGDRGDLVRVLPQVYVDARLLFVPPAPGVPLLGRLPAPVARRAALAWGGGRTALGGVTALTVWGVRGQVDGEPVHLDVAAGSGLRPRPHLMIHHRDGFSLASPRVVTRRRLPVVRLERALVDAWPVLSPVDRPAPVIRAVNDRLTTPQRIGSALAAVPRLSGRAQLRTLLDRLAAGCRSPLEIWGHDHVFTGPGLPAFRRQARIVVGRRTMYLDVYAERERVDFELDGATTHGDPREREIDLRRDALLATVGILVVRFARHRLIHEPDEVRHEVRAILATRGRIGGP
jgi:very-short-patch-repair endonuclease